MDEQDLIQRAGRGEEEAFEQLVLAHEKMVYNLCLRMTGDREEAFDLSQETFLKAWHAISLFQGDSKFTTWLSRIASNTCIDHLRKQKRKNTVSLTLQGEEDASIEAQIADCSQDPARLLELAEDRETVRQAFSSLPGEDRLILSLRAIEDMSYQDIGQALSLKPGTVKSRIFRARERLRQNLAGNLSEKAASKKGKGGGKK